MGRRAEEVQHEGAILCCMLHAPSFYGHIIMPSYDMAMAVQQRTEPQSLSFDVARPEGL